MLKKLFHSIIFIFFSLSFWISSNYATKTLPIVLVHGILSDDYEMKPIIEHIHKYLPETYVKNVKLGYGVLSSFWNIYKLIEWFKNELQHDEQLHDGCIIIAHSQGGLVARYFVQCYNSPKVHTYISFGSPQQGVYGTPGTLDNRFTWLNWLEEKASSLLYSSLFQNYVSFASYWHDPLNYELYLEKCCFLPYLNNEKPHPLAQRFKENICSLTNMVLVNSTAEDIIEPAISCHFGFYKKGSHEIIEHLEETDLFLQDKLGLATLAESGRLHLRTAHCTHTDYQEDENNFLENALPFLKQANA